MPIEASKKSGPVNFLSTGSKLIGYFLLWILMVRLVEYLEFDLLDFAQFLKHLKINLPDFNPQSKLYNEIFRQLIVFVSMLITNGFFVWVVDLGKTRTKFVAKKKFWHDLVVGVAFGIMWAGGSVALYQITGSSDLSDVNYYKGIWLWLIPVGINVVSQEYIFRGYMYTLFQKNYNNVVAVLVPSIIYLALHPMHVSGGLIAVLDVTTAGFLLSMLRYHTKGIFVPIIVHFFWNASTGVVLGTVDLGGYPSIFMNSLVTNGNEILHGGTLGFEASAITLIVTALLIDLVSVLINDARHPETVKYVFGSKKKDLMEDAIGCTYATPIAEDQTNVSPF